MSDFMIISMEILDGVTQFGDRPAYQGTIRSYHTQAVYKFDNRSGSWLSSRATEAGVRLEPSHDLAAALQERMRVEAKKSAKEAENGRNPFMEVR